jgi:protein-S-isoprenylcysteine O-methyltransferase Ste14
MSMNKSSKSKNYYYKKVLNSLGVSHRGFVGLIIISASMITCEPTLTSIFVGLVVSLTGESLRIWTAGYGYKVNTFSLDGPYRFVRHPYFLGSSLFYLGICLAGRNVWVSAIAILLLSLGFSNEVLRNEKRAEHALGPAFSSYRAQVPSFFPLVWPKDISGMPISEAGGFSLRNAVLTGRYREIDALLVILLAFALQYLSTRITDLTVFHAFMAVVASFFIIGRLLFFKVNSRPSSSS